MSDYKVYVISKAGVPLMPTKRFGKVRRLLKSGRAKVVNIKPFTIRLLYDTPEHTQPLVLGIDIGGKHLGYAVRDEKSGLIEAGCLETRTAEVSENMSERQARRRGRRRHRRGRRQRRAIRNKTNFEQRRYKIAGAEEELTCKTIGPKLVRFNNRRRSEGWLTPTARHLRDTHIQFVENIARRLPIAKVCFEYASFDLQKLDNPEIYGVEYQNGRKKGYANSREYVLCRDRHTCRLCAKSSVPLQVHHVVWESRGGGDMPENLLTLCEKCHDRVHKSPKTDAKVVELFAGIKKRMVHATLVNTIVPSFYQWLQTRFGEVGVTYGYETKEKRMEMGLPKRHHIDAYLVSLENAEQAADIDWEEFPVLKYVQFRRHHRQIIHAVRDRNYKQGKKIVAKNRNKRTGQREDSRAELIEEKGKAYLSRLRVLPGRKVIRSKFDKFRKGDSVVYKGRRYVVKGYGEMGRRLGFVGHKDYVPAKDCRLVARNKGIVCL